MMRRGVHTSKGFGRIATTVLQSPMDLSLGITEGFHNAPKLWGDETVRPPQKVSDIKSGARAIGKEFAFGFYDGVTGLVTQPWKGAQKEGTSGFFKGIGKGIGGFVAKPGAALFGIPAYMMKGVYKEVQGLFGSNVQNYIVVSRTAQGYEEWLQSSDAGKQDVIDQWKLIQKYLKKKHHRDEMMQDLLEDHRKKNTGGREACQNYEQPASSSHSTNTDVPTLDSESVLSAMSGSQPLEESLGVAETSETMQKMSRGDAEEDVNTEQAIQGNVSQLERQRQEAKNHQVDQENWRQVLVASEDEARRHANEASEYERQLEQVMAQSLKEQRQRGSDNERDSGMGLDNDDYEQSSAVSSGSQPPSYDPGHLAGTTQSEFKAQLQRHPREKTAEERTEEEIVMAYIKKQSLLEMHHQGNGKGRAAATEDEDDEELQKALEINMQVHEHDEEYGYVETSRS
jgi:hypothetical protein